MNICLHVLGFESRQEEPVCWSAWLCSPNFCHLCQGVRMCRLSFSSRSFCCGERWWSVTYPFHALLVICFPVHGIFFFYLFSCGSACRQSVASLYFWPFGWAHTIPWVQTYDNLMAVTGDMNCGRMRIRGMCSRAAFYLLLILFLMQLRM